MIEKAKISGGEGFLVTCDSCGNYQFFAFNEFIEAVREAKRQGWIFRLEGDDWRHYCGKECAGKR